MTVNSGHPERSASLCTHLLTKAGRFSSLPALTSLIALKQRKKEMDYNVGYFGDMRLKKMVNYLHPY